MVVRLNNRVDIGEKWICIGQKRSSNCDRIKKVHDWRCCIMDSGESAALANFIMLTQTTKRIDEAIESLETIGNFLPIRTMRDSFCKLRNYEIVTQIITKPAAEGTK